MSRGTSRSRRIVHASLAAALLLVVPAGPADAKTKVKTKTFSSGPINRAIPDPVGITGFAIEEFIKIKKRGTIKDVNVRVRITHPDNRFVLLDFGNVGGAPGFSSLTEEGWRSLAFPKAADFGAGAADCTGAMTTFDSDAPFRIDEGVPPYAGSFRPMSFPLDVFDGKEMRGKWRLELSDQQPGDAGVLNCWQLKIRYKPKEGGKKR